MKVVVVAGPTGTGKSRLALHLAESTGGEIVNFDSIQIHRGFDIGSAKPSAADQARVPHHLFDIISADDPFNAADYGRLARATCEEITGRGRLPILVGGTFFYLRALLSGLPEMPGRDEEIRRRLAAIAARPRGPARLHRWLSRVDPPSGARIAEGDRHRVERALEVWISAKAPISAWNRPSAAVTGSIDALKIALSIERADLVQRLEARVEEMYRAGLVEETRLLLAVSSPEARPFGAIGYREAAGVIAGTLPLPEAIAETKRRTRAYAKRQMTWLRSERNVQWLPAADEEVTFRAALRLVERFRLD